MDATVKTACKSQLIGLADRIEMLNGKELCSELVNACTSLMSMSEKLSPSDTMSDSEIKDLVMSYTALYFIMNGFMEKAGARIPLDKIQEELQLGNQRYSDLVYNYESAVTSREKQEKLIAEKQAEIQGIQSENGALFTKYEAMTEQHEKLKKLSETYSEENLRKLESECARLTEETGVLKERADTVNENTGLCLESITESLNRLSGILTTKSEQAKATAERADLFRKNVETVIETHKNYTSWFNVLKTPLQQFEEDLGKSEADNLKKALDEESLKRYHQTFKQVSDGLDDLDSLVRKCTDASNQDLKSTITKAGK